MDIDISLINSLKRGEYLKVSEGEILACLPMKKCSYFFYSGCVGINCTHNDDIMYKLFKET